MKKRIIYVAVDGSVFDDETLCRGYEESLMEEYELLKSIKAYDMNRNLITCPSFEEFYVDKENSYKFFAESYYLSFDSNKDVDEVKSLFDKLAYEKHSLMVPISPRSSIYDTYMFSDGEGFIPIDDEIDRCRKEFEAMKRLVGGILYE